MAVYKRDIIDINLETGNIYRSWLKHSIGYKDQKADHFGVRVFRDGEAVSLTGVSVQGVFMPPQGSPIAITSGNIVSGNVAEVVLPQACYNYDGQFTLAIKLVDSTNSVTGTVRIVDGMVDNTHASGTVAPTSAVPTYQEVLSVYEQAIVVIGKSVRFDTDQSLTDAQKTTARTNIAAASTGDVSDLKSALYAEPYVTTGFLQGARGVDLSITSRTDRCTTNSVWNLKAGDKFKIINPTGRITAIGGVNNGSFVYENYWLSGNFEYTVTSLTEGIYYANFAYSSNGENISPSDLSSVQISIKRKTAITDLQEDVEDLQEDVDDLQSNYQSETVMQSNIDLIKLGPWQRGTIGANGEEGNYANRIRSGYIDVTRFTTIDLSVKTGFKYNLHVYNQSKTWITSTDWMTTDLSYTIPENVVYVRFVLANTSNTDIGIETNRSATALATYKINADLIDVSDNYTLFRGLKEDVQLGSWSIGWSYANGNIGLPSEFPQYVCTQTVQVLPFGIVITPDIGFQFLVRIFNTDESAITRSTEWLTAPYYIPANTHFTINMSKTVLENVTDIDDYISALHVRSYALNNNTSPAIRKKTKIAILGDSISTFTGYSEADYRSPYYPTGDVQNVWQMWWYIVADALGATDGISVSAISRSAYVDWNDATYPPVYNSDRISRLGTGGDPDVIFVNAGTNDGFSGQTGDIAYTTDITELEALSNSTSRGIALTIRKLQNAYPSAKIVLLIPKQVKFADMPSGYDPERVMKIADEIKTYAEMYGVWKVIDLRKCGINQSNVSSYCGDGNTHPNAKGMREMAQYILDEFR